MKIFVRPPDKGKKDDVEVDINPDELIEFVRKRIQDKKGLDCHKLIFRGSTLKDDRTLKDYSVTEGSVLVIQAQYYGQYMPMGVHPSIEKKRTAEEAMLDAQPTITLDPEIMRVATDAAAENVTDASVGWIGMQVATYGEKGMRRQMEDEHLICASLREQCPSLPKERDYSLFAIFDGHGGKAVAGFIKTYMAVELGNSLANDEPKEGTLNDKRLRKAVEATFLRLDARIATELAGAYDGSTAVLLLVNKEAVVCCNLGDSMGYLCRKNPEDEIQAIPLQMRQHKCWMMKEKERILRAGGAVENGRINGVLEVSRAFGDISLKKFGVLCTPEYMKFKLDREKDGFVLLGCDGFWNAWTAAEALDYTSELIENESARATREGEAVDLKGVCRELVTHVIEEKKAQDNVSVLILRHAEGGVVDDDVGEAH
jgi:integrin-linked kinase-associated serine/threonine phosphatase 2C